MIHKLLLAAALCLVVTTLAFAQPRTGRPARGLQRPTSVRNVRVSTPNRIMYSPATRVTEHGSGGTFATRIDRSRFNRYYYPSYYGRR